MTQSIGADTEARSKTAIGASMRKTMRELIEARKPDVAIAAAKHRVRVWQNRRFARTYADLAAQTRYKSAVDFFLTELYSDADMSARDTDVEKVMPIMIRLMPAPALRTIRDALAFETLCERLDADLARQLGHARLTEQSYGDAFRACGQPGLRCKQIDYVQKVGHALDALTRWPMLGTTLRLMRGPAKSAGFSVLQEFLERGFVAFRHLRGADHFVSTIVERETAIVKRLFAAHPRPFELEDPS
ncbi:MAG: hypothetical protein ABIS68_06890 [Casimicrobiaceae bacterium]